ncbi:tubulin-specific chaperone E [Polypterus senegalus]|uniref:tubulin-specific chaperone E n=1 Tax=Polypterus senegalus TaxID=55291 RepID=UPI0019660263|nr:tubulin-specific chaperone E [Polypterus senegalus]
MIISTSDLCKMSDEVPCDTVGRRILCAGERGTVRFVGYVPPASGLWLGVEWDNPERGKHDGSHEGIRYFNCSHPTGASFIRPKKASFGVDFLTAVKKRYEIQEASEITEEMKISNTFVELVNGAERQLYNLTEVSLRGCEVSSGGKDDDIQQTVPNVILLDLSENLLASWRNVADIVCRLKKLKVLILSQNKLAIPENPSSLAQAFASLREMALNKASITWSNVLQCAPMWPVLEELYLSDNEICTLQKPINVLQSLKLLDLGNNRLSDGGDLLEIAFLPRLEKLILSNNQLSSVCFSDAQPGCKSAMFTSLKFLAVDKNHISQWSFVNELEKLQSLQQLSCLYNPLMTSEKSTETIRQLIIAKIGQLLFLNKSEVLPDERKGAELDYRKLFGKEWLEAGGHWDEDKNHPNESFIAQHPRFQFLIKKFGPPEEGELKQQQPFALKNQLLTLTFRFPGRPDAPIEKKLPNSMTVQKVKGLLSRLLKVPATELNLTYTRAKIEDKEVDLDNDLRSLKFFSIEDGDTVLVRWT